jgi:F-type H+-transporting ATPase subunit b
MDQILKDFGVQPLLLGAQIVNFLVLLFILNKVLYKPVLKILQQRKDTIAQSLKNAEEIEQKLLQTEEDREKKLEEAGKEARKILEEATATAGVIIKEAHVKAGLDIEEMLKKGQESIKFEQEKMHQEMREELADIVVAALEKVTGKTINKTDQKRMVEDTIKRM